MSLQHRPALARIVLRLVGLVGGLLVGVLVWHYALEPGQLDELVRTPPVVDYRPDLDEVIVVLERPANRQQEQQIEAALREVGLREVARAETLREAWVARWTAEPRLLDEWVSTIPPAAATVDDALAVAIAGRPNDDERWRAVWWARPPVGHDARRPADQVDLGRRLERVSLRVNPHSGATLWWTSTSERLRQWRQAPWGAWAMGAVPGAAALALAVAVVFRQLALWRRAVALAGLAGLAAGGATLALGGGGWAIGWLEAWPVAMVLTGATALVAARRPMGAGWWTLGLAAAVLSVALGLVTGEEALAWRQGLLAAGTVAVVLWGLSRLLAWVAPPAVAPIGRPSRWVVGGLWVAGAVLAVLANRPLLAWPGDWALPVPPALRAAEEEARAAVDPPHWRRIWLTTPWAGESAPVVEGRGTAPLPGPLGLAQQRASETPAPGRLRWAFVPPEARSPASAGEGWTEWRGGMHAPLVGTPWLVLGGAVLLGGLLAWAWGPRPSTGGRGWTALWGAMLGLALCPASAHPAVALLKLGLLLGLWLGGGVWLGCWARPTARLAEEERR